MKHLIIIIPILAFLSIPKLSFGVEHPKSSGPAIELLDSLPTNFSYRIDTDSLARLHSRKNEPPIVYFKDEMTIGCFQPMKVKPVFSLSIGHEFLFDDMEDYPLLKRGEKTSRFKIILYAVKKENSKQDSLLIKALDEYCTYGQANYVTQSEDFILFTYMRAVNAEGLIMRYQKLGFWNLIESHLIQNLNAGASLEARIQLPASVNNPYHKSEVISGKFLWASGGLPARKIKTQNETLHISGLPATAHTYLHLKKNGKAVIIKNYNQPKANHYKYKGSWYMDNLYIYVYNPSDDFKIFRIHNENTLMHISEKYGFSRIMD